MRATKSKAKNKILDHRFGGTYHPQPQKSIQTDPPAFILPKPKPTAPDIAEKRRDTEKADNAIEVDVDADTICSFEDDVVPSRSGSGPKSIPSIIEAELSSIFHLEDGIDDPDFGQQRSGDVGNVSKGVPEVQEGEGGSAVGGTSLSLSEGYPGFDIWRD